MPNEVDLRGIEGFAFELTASSVGRYVSLNDWGSLSEGFNVTLPYRTNIAPSYLMFMARATAFETIGYF